MALIEEQLEWRAFNTTYEEDVANITPYVTEIDMGNAMSLRTEIVVAIGEETVKQVVLDLGNINSMDSTGFGVLKAGHNRAENNGKRFTIVNTRPVIQQLIEMLSSELRYDLEIVNPGMGGQSAESLS